MNEKKIRIRTVAREWFDDYSKISYDIYLLKDKKSYEDIVTFLKTKYKAKDIQHDSNMVAFEFERRGFTMDVFVKKQSTGKAMILAMVVCHFTPEPDGYYRVSINKITQNDTQTVIQNKFPEIFDNNTVYFIDAVELPICGNSDQPIHYTDALGVTSMEYTDKNEAIQTARILAKELANARHNCFCITVIQGIKNCHKRYTNDTTNRRERDVFTIGTKSMPETLLARRRYHFYPITVDEYVDARPQDKASKKGCNNLYVLTIAISDKRQFVMETRQFHSKENAHNAANNAVMEWAKTNKERKHSWENFEYEYKLDKPEIIEVYSATDNARLTAMITEINLDVCED